MASSNEFALIYNTRDSFYSKLHNTLLYNYYENLPSYDDYFEEFRISSKKHTVMHQECLVELLETPSQTLPIVLYMR